jgi:hypothetical protein
LSLEALFFLGAASDAIRFKICNCSSFKSRSFGSVLPTPARQHAHTKPAVSVHLVILVIIVSIRPKEGYLYVPFDAYSDREPREDPRPKRIKQQSG